MSEQPKKKGMNKWLLIALIVVGVAAIGGTGYAVLKETNPMVMYLDALKNTVDEQTERMSDYTEPQTELRERQLEEAYKSEGKLTMDMNIQGDQIQQMVPQVALVQGLLSQVQVDLDSKYNPESKELYGAMDLNMQGNSIANGSFYQNEETFAAQAPFVYDKYFALGNDQLGAVMEKFGESSEGLEEMPNFVEYAQSQMSQEEAEEMLKDYAVAMGKELNQDQFSLSDGEYDGESYDKVTIEVSEEEAKQMLVTLLEKIKDDERIQDMLEQQSAMQGNVEGVAGVEDLQADLDKAIENIDEVKIPGGITGEAYIKDDIVAHQTWNMNLTGEDEEVIAVEMANDYTTESDSKYTSAFQVNVSPESKEESITVKYEEKGEEKDDSLNVDYTIGVTSDLEQDNFTANLLLNSVYKEGSMDTDFELQLEGEAFQQQAMPSVSGFVNTTSEQDGDDQVIQTTNVGLSLSMDDPNMGTMAADLEFNFENALTFTDDLEFPALAEDNTVQLMDVTDEEMAQIGSEVQMNFQQHISSMMGGLGGLGGF
ncbi:DUF6583 family protein [Halobacillus salinus]|uniref:DUF945 family protein n=1 Tax=Halobacillus salinus TaxID=192814 RepID=A0A4Z0GU07_9BACI|nr:DUF6583 family protein [Halobacillus salinus]TGB01121.1 hypothetical protein E4663_18390 [Halobacillus salinus]